MFPKIAAHIRTGWVVGVVIATLDLLAAVLHNNRALSTYQLIVAVVASTLLIVWVGWLAGLMFGLARLWVLRAPVLEHGLRLFRAPVLTRGSPDAYSAFLLHAAPLGFAVAVAQQLHMYTMVRFVRQDLAGLVVGAGTMGTWVLTRGAVAPFARRIGRAWASLGVIASPLVLVTSMAVLLLTSRILFPHTWMLYLPTPIQQLSIALPFVWGLVHCVLHRFDFPRPTLKQSLVPGVICLFGSVAGALVIVPFSGARNFIESQTQVARTMLGVAWALSDLDRDGFGYLYGGGDCEEFDERVHIGAADPLDDALDTDCVPDSEVPLPRYQPTLAPFVASDPSRRENILLVTVDALNRNHIHSEGGRAATPFFDQFLSGAVRFPKVIPQAPRSTLSFGSLWTGLYASQIQWQYSGTHWPTLPEESLTLAEIAKAQGYQTTAIVGTDYFSHMIGFFQGFDTVDAWPTSLRSPREWPQERFRALAPLLREPWFVWVHLMNVHAVYMEDEVARLGHLAPITLYNMEVAHADRIFGEILNAVPAREHTTVVLASDHGEAFGEHDTWFHASSLYEEQLRSVLAIQGHEISPRVVTEPVALTDLMPTLAERMGASGPPVAARSLNPGIASGQFTRRPIISELLPDLADIRALRLGDWKGIWSSERGTFECFNVMADPQELHPVDDHEECRNLRRSLFAWTAQQFSSQYAGRFERPPEDLPRVNFNLGGVSLLGWRLTTREHALTIRLYFQVTDGYSALPRVVVTSGSARDSQQIASGLYPVERWRRGRYLSHEVTLRHISDRDAVMLNLDPPLSAEIVLRAANAR